MHLYTASAQYSHGCEVQSSLKLVAFSLTGTVVVSSYTLVCSVLAGNAVAHACRFVDSGLATSCDLDPTDGISGCQFNSDARQCVNCGSPTSRNCWLRDDAGHYLCSTCSLYQHLTSHDVNTHLEPGASPVRNTARKVSDAFTVNKTCRFGLFFHGPQKRAVLGFFTTVGLTYIHTCRSYGHTPRNITNGASPA